MLVPNAKKIQVGNGLGEKTMVHQKVMQHAIHVELKPYENRRD